MRIHLQFQYNNKYYIKYKTNTYSSTRTMTMFLVQWNRLHTNDTHRSKHQQTRASRDGPHTHACMHARMHACTHNHARTQSCKRTRSTHPPASVRTHSLVQIIIHIGETCYFFLIATQSRACTVFYTMNSEHAKFAN